MRAARVLLGVVLTVLLALCAPNLVLVRQPALWSWLATADSGSDLAVWGAARAADPDDVDIVVVGSSMAGSNVSTWMLERDTGRTTLNLGVNGIAATGTAMWVPEIRRLKPTTVVWMTGPTALEDRPLRDQTAFDWRMAWAAWGPGVVLRGDVWSGALSDASWLVRLRRVPRLAWDGQLAEEAFHLANRPRMGPRRFRLAARTHAAQLRTAGITSDGAGVRAMCAAIDVLRSDGIEVVLMAAPVHPTVTGEGNYSPAHLDALDAVVGKTQARMLPVAEHPDWTDDDFRDPIHLDHVGQRKLTEYLIGELR